MIRTSFAISLISLVLVATAWAYSPVSSPVKSPAMSAISGLPLANGVTESAPVNTVAPVASGAAAVGATLSCSTGTWDNSPTSYAYQWRRNGSNIDLATASAYLLLAADNGTAVDCVVTASNSGGSASADSNNITPSDPVKISDLLGDVVCEWNFQSSASYSGSGQYIYSLDSTPADGSAVENCTLQLGNSSSVSTDDPTLTGSAGSQTAFMAFDGGDAISLASSSNNTTVNGLHFTSASWTVAIAGRFPTGSGSPILFTTQSPGAASENGVTGFWANSTRYLGTTQGDGTSAVNNYSTEQKFVFDDDVVFVISHDGDTDQTCYYTDTLAPQCVSHNFGTTSTNAARTLLFCARGDLGGSFCPNGTRLYGMAVLNDNVSQAEAQDIFNIMGNQRGAGYVYIPEDDGPTENTWIAYTGGSSGSISSIFPQGTIRAHDVLAFTSSRALFAYRDGNDGDAGKMVYLNRDGVTLSSGTAVATGIADPLPHHLLDMGNDRVVLVAGENSTSGNVNFEATLIDVSGSSPAILDSVRFTSYSDGSTLSNAIKLTGTKLIAATDTSETTDIINLTAIDITGDSITYGSAINIGAIAAANYPGMARLTDSTFMVNDNTNVHYASVTGDLVQIIDTLPINLDGGEIVNEVSMVPKNTASVVVIKENTSGTEARVFGVNGSEIFRASPTTITDNNVWMGYGQNLALGDLSYMQLGRETGGSQSGFLSVFTAAGDAVTSVLKDYQYTGEVIADHGMATIFPETNYVLAVWQDETSSPIQQVGYRFLLPDTGPPVNTVLPAISGNTYTGQTLTCSNGTWVGTTPFSYARTWERDGTIIGGETASTYVLTGSDEGTDITCVVTATNSEGSTVAESAAVSATVAPPVNSVAPVASGTGTVGQTLSVTNGTWSGSPAYTYQWRRNGSNIGSATSSAYTLVSADGGTNIDAVVTATNAGGAVTADSNDIAVAASESTITGWSKIGNTFTTGITSDYADICGLSATTIAMANSTDNNIRTLTWDGTSWSQTGNLLSVTSASTGDLGIGCISSTRIAVAYRINGTSFTLTAYDFDGTNWAAVGNVLTKSSTVSDFYPRLAVAPSGTYIFVATSSQMLAYTFDGTDFTQVAQITGLTGTVNAAIAALSDSLVARINDNGDDLDMYSFSGTAFTSTGNQYNTTAYLGAYGMVALDGDEMLYYSGAGNVQGLKYTAPNVATQGSDYNNACISSWPRGMARLTRTLVAAQSYSGGICTLQATE